MAKNRVIGKNNQLPWHFSADMKHFKKLTTGNTVLMGRKTFESLGKPLPNRKNFVLTYRVMPDIADITWFHSVDEALQKVSTENCYIIGGAQLFEQTITQIHGIYLTKIEQEYSGDVYYPEIPEYFKIEQQFVLQDNPLLEVFFYKNSYITDDLFMK